MYPDHCEFLLQMIKKFPRNIRRRTNITKKEITLKGNINLAFCSWVNYIHKFIVTIGIFKETVCLKSPHDAIPIQS